LNAAFVHTLSLGINDSYVTKLGLLETWKFYVTAEIFPEESQTPFFREITT